MPMRLFVGYAEECVVVGVGVFWVYVGCGELLVFIHRESNPTACVEISLTYLQMTLAVLKDGLVPIAASLV
jgi:hypothetical protein